MGGGTWNQNYCVILYDIFHENLLISETSDWGFVLMVSAHVIRLRFLQGLVFELQQNLLYDFPLPHEETPILLSDRYQE